MARSVTDKMLNTVRRIVGVYSVETEHINRVYGRKVARMGEGRGV
jgi:hypothetical protein